MTTIKILGMTCEHCVVAVIEALSRVPGVTNVDVVLASGIATFTEEQPVDMEEVRRAIEQAGYKLG